MRRQAYFVVLEGLDGSGTTTVAALLGEALQTRDQRVRVTAEPTDGAWGQMLRRHLGHEFTLDPLTAALAFTADRAAHLDGLIRPSLARGRTVICDRYLLSTLAYQGAEGVDPEAVLAASAAFDRPDITFFLDVPVDVRAARMVQRKSVDRYEARELQERLRAGYEHAIALLRVHGYRIDEVDASRPVDEVVEDVVARLDALG